MAAIQALKKLEEQLNCSICLGTYTNPKQLQCNHVYCQLCLVRLVIRDQQGQLTLTCPTCRQATPIPPTGVAGLQAAFHINHLLDIQESFRKINLPDHEKVTDDTTGVNPVRKNSKCSGHDDKVELYCETCGELVCIKCIMRGGKHHDHEYELLSQAFDRCKEAIASSVMPIEKQLTIIKETLNRFDTRCGEIKDQQAAIEVDIFSTFGQLHRVLDDRKTKLISHLQQITQRKMKTLAAQRELLETTQAQLSSCLDFMKENLKTDSHELLMMTTIVKQMNELTTTIQPDVLMPGAEADLVFSDQANLNAACLNYGQVVASGSPDPAESHATGKGIVTAEVGEKSTAVVHLVNFRGEPCQEKVMSIECELVSEITGARSRGSIMNSGKNRYNISYQPTVKGRHQLHVKVEGKHINGSPFSIAVKLPLEKLNTPILTIDGVRGAYGVAVTKRNEILVTDEAGHCVSVLSTKGEKIHSFGKRGSGEGQFKYPEGVTTDGDGNILVADCWNHRIQKFTADGQFLAAVGAEGSEPLQFSYPRGIAFNASNKNMYIVDGNDRVQVLNSDLTFSGTFGRKGIDNGQFNAPCGIACDNTGKVYVADSDNHRIQVFTAEGDFLSTFGCQGEIDGKMCYPVGIAVDSSGIIYVSESYNHRISLFTSEGQFVTLFGAVEGEFNYPRGIAVDSSEVVFVCDSGNKRVQVY